MRRVLILVMVAVNGIAGCATGAGNTGGAMPVADDVMTQIMAGSGIITVTFPANPRSGQTLQIAVRTNYTTITLAGNGKTLSSGTIGTTAGSSGKWQYYAADTTWDRVA